MRCRLAMPMGPVSSWLVGDPRDGVRRPRVGRDGNPQPADVFRLVVVLEQREVQRHVDGEADEPDEHGLEREPTAGEVVRQHGEHAGERAVHQRNAERTR